MGKKVCRHCSAHPMNRPRGLCWGCFYNPAIRVQYPSTSIFAKRGVGNGHVHDAPLPRKPTLAEPGTEDKLLVLMERAERNECLFHPGDRMLGSSPVPWAVPIVGVPDHGHSSDSDLCNEPSNGDMVGI